MDPKKNQNWWMEMDSQFEIENLEDFKETKQLLQKFDSLESMELPADEDYFEKLHDSIMNQIEQKEIKNDWRVLWHRHGSMIKKCSAAMVVMVMVLLGRETHHSQNVVDSASAVLADAVERNPHIESTVLVYQHQDDFFVDLARESLDHLSVDQMQGLMGSDAKN